MLNLFEFLSQIILPMMHSFYAENKRPLDTSKVIMEVSKQKIFTYYLPGYLRLNVKNFTSINLQNLESEMNAAIIFSVYYGALPEYLIEYLEKDIKLNFERDETIQLTEAENLTEVKRIKETNTIHFYVKKIFHTRIESDVFWSPFQLIHNIFTITIQSIMIGETVIQINLMDHPSKLEKLLTSQLNTFGNYSLAVAYTEAQYSNRGVKKANEFHNGSEKEDIKISNEDIIIEIIDTSGDFLIAQNMGCFRHAHFNIPLYKMPINSLSTIFIPLWLLGIINLGVFFENEDLGNRIQAISGLMVAFAALIPTIRNQIPPHPGWIFIEILVYLEAGTCLLALFHSVYVRNEVNYSINWRQSFYFLISLSITIFTFVYVAFMVILHYCVWKPDYTQLQITEDQRKARLDIVRQNLAMNQQQKKRIRILRMRQNISNNRNSLIKFIRSEWKNRQCDACFRQIQMIQTQSTFMELQEPQITTHNNLDEQQRKNQLTPQQRYRNALKNVSMNVELDDQISQSAKGTINDLSIDGKM